MPAGRKLFPGHPGAAPEGDSFARSFRDGKVHVDRIREARVCEGRAREGRVYACDGARERGFTFLEAIAALLIISIVTVGFFQAFAFGAVELERLGYRRQALALLEGEMEYWRARFEAADAEHPVSASEAAYRNGSITPDPGSRLAFSMHSQIGPPQGFPGLVYQKLSVRVSYSRADLADTLVLEARQYVH